MNKFMAMFVSVWVFSIGCDEATDKTIVEVDTIVKTGTPGGASADVNLGKEVIIEDALKFDKTTSKKKCTSLIDAKTESNILAPEFRELSIDLSKGYTPDTITTFCVLSGLVEIPTNHIFNIEVDSTRIMTNANLPKQGDFAELVISAKQEFSSEVYGDIYSVRVQGIRQGLQENILTKASVTDDDPIFKKMTCADVRKTDTTAKYEIKFDGYGFQTLALGEGNVKFLTVPRFKFKLEKCL